MHEAKALIQAWLDEESSLAPIVDLLGIEPVEAEPGLAVVALEVDERLHNAIGSLHGGVYVDLADVAFGVALAMDLEAGEQFSTISLQASYFRPIRTGRILARATVEHRGSRTAHLACSVHEASGGDELCRVTAIYDVRSTG